MTDALRFIFSSFWTFAGTLILVAVLAQAAIYVLAILAFIIRGKPL